MRCSRDAPWSWATRPLTQARRGDRHQESSADATLSSAGRVRVHGAEPVSGRAGQSWEVMNTTPARPCARGCLPAHARAWTVCMLRAEFTGVTPSSRRGRGDAGVREG